MRTYTIVLTSNNTGDIPQVLDHYLIYAPFVQENFTYPTTAFGGDMTTTNYPFTADDQQFFPWGFIVRDIITDLEIGPLKGPYTLIFSPSGLDTRQSFIPKIVYEFGDGTRQVVERSITKNVEGVSNFTADDPNEITVSHTYYPTGTGTTVYKPTVTVYNSYVTRNIFNISLSTTPASIYELNDVHLINDTQLQENTTQQAFLEVVEPNTVSVAKIIESQDGRQSLNIPFDPATSLQNYQNSLILWLDASDALTLEKDAYNNVYTWRDKSSYASVFTSNGPYPRFLYTRLAESGRKSVKFFNGALMSIPGNQAQAFETIFTAGSGYSVFAVIKPNSPNGTILSFDINQGNLLVPNLSISLNEDDNSLNIEQGDIGYIREIKGLPPAFTEYQPTRLKDISFNLKDYSLFSVTLSGTENAQAYITADTLITRIPKQNYIYNINQDYDRNLCSVLLGNSNVYDTKLIDAEISEILIYNKPLTPQDVQAVQAYLIKKWDLTLKTN